MADIIFLVDGSQNVDHEQFQSMQRLMSSLVNSSSIGEHHVHVGAIVYSTEPKVQFALNKYNTKKELRQAVSHLKPLGGTYSYTSKALSFSLNYFSDFNGRKHERRRRKFLIVITNEEADDAQQLEKASAKLRDNGISVFGIGVKQDNNKQLPNQLFTMANNHNRVFYVDNFNALEILDRKISQEICKVNQAGKSCPLLLKCS